MFIFKPNVDTLPNQTTSRSKVSELLFDFYIKAVVL
jgi:hypothetical protein